MNRRAFLRSSTATVTALALAPWRGDTRGNVEGGRRIMTVGGPIAAEEMGLTLTHEHLLADFRSPEEKTRSPQPYNPDEVLEIVLPHLKQLRGFGCRTFVDCTAVFLGRNAALLKRISEESGLQILTVTGNYAAMEQRALPPYVFTDTIDALAQRWINEWKNGIEQTNVRPGLIKLGFDGGPLPDVEKKLIRAATIAHLETGLTIGAHISGPKPSSTQREETRSWSAVSALEQLSVLEDAGVDPSAWIWIHAQNEKDSSHHIRAARRGAWISFDGVGGGDTVTKYVERVRQLRGEGLLHRVLVSQDAGWYWVGEPRGRKFRPYDTVFTSFIPALRQAGFTDGQIDTLFIHNPADAFSIGVRRRRRGAGD
jgi:phosphotriesterase-related protein